MKWLILSLSLVLVGCSSKVEGTLEGVAPVLTPSTPPASQNVAQLCGWLKSEGFIANAEQDTVEVAFLESEHEEDHYPTYEKTTQRTVRFEGSCANGGDGIRLVLTGESTYSNTGVYKKDRIAYEILLDAIGVQESLSRYGHDTWKPSSQTESFTAIFHRDPGVLGFTMATISGALSLELFGPGIWTTSRSGERLGYSPFAKDESMELTFKTRILLNSQAKTWQLENNAEELVYYEFTDVR